jgi:hypothetical protein
MNTSSFQKGRVAIAWGDGVSTNPRGAIMNFYKITLTPIQDNANPPPTIEY